MGKYEFLMTNINIFSRGVFMKILFIEKNDKFSKIESILNKVRLKENKIKIYKDISIINIKSKQKIINKIKRILIKEKVDKVILSKEIKENKEFINLLYSNSINISDDRWLFKMLTDEVIDKVIKNKKKQESELHITVNELNNINQNIIYKFSKEFKRVNIITNHIGKFKKIAEELYGDGIIITVTNNKRKSLSKATLILNIDFPKEILNQFQIFDKATIINLEGNMKIKKKRFEGKIINDIEIKTFEDEELLKFIEENNLDSYDIKDICEVLNIVPKCDIILT